MYFFFNLDDEFPLFIPLFKKLTQCDSLNKINKTHTRTKLLKLQACYKIQMYELEERI